MTPTPHYLFSMKRIKKVSKIHVNQANKTLSDTFDKNKNFQKSPVFQNFHLLSFTPVFNPLFHMLFDNIPNDIS